eukprot:scaffold12515_cov56-Phaeocystis_antarctica.AAC.2
MSISFERSVAPSYCPLGRLDWRATALPATDCALRGEASPRRVDKDAVSILQFVQLGRLGALLLRGVG